MKKAKLALEGIYNSGKPYPRAKGHKSNTNSLVKKYNQLFKKILTLTKPKRDQKGTFDVSFSRCGYNLTTFTAGFGSNQRASFDKNRLKTGLYFNISGILQWVLGQIYCYMEGLFALDLFQTAGYNQDTILVTPYIILQLTTGSNTVDKNKEKGIINATPVLHTAGHIK